MKSRIPAPRLLCLALAWTAVHAQDIPKNLPRQDVVQVPAIGEGLCLSNAFQSHMVLQRDKPVAIWGWADPGAEVTVSFSGKSAKTTAGADRSWKLALDPIPANAKPEVMTVSSGGKSVRLENVLVGDVWVLGGQSNMEFEIAKVNDGEVEIASANFPEIRLLTMPQGKGFESVKSFERLYEWSDWSSRHFLKGEWQVCSPETVREFSAIGYVFGRRIHMASRVPVGLIDTSIGGTTVETWTPDEVLRGVDGAETRAKLKEWEDKIAAYDPQADLQKQLTQFENRKKKLEAEGKSLPADAKPPTEPRPGPVADRNRPGYCYASVIRPLEGLSACGAVFHQGFNNCFDGSAGARMYYQVFGGMIGAWRKAFGDAQLPFCIISLCTAGDPQTADRFSEPMFDAGPMIREAQYRTFRDLRDAGDTTIGYASSFDFRKSWYHPQIKIPAGERAAKWAMASHYKLLGGRDSESIWLPPAVEKMEAADGRITLTMSTEITTADDSDGKLLGFAIAGDDRRFHQAEVAYLTTGESKGAKGKPVQNRKVLVLSSPHVAEPKHYRHAWARNPLTNLTSQKQIPIPTLRSDDWTIEETPLLPFPAPADNPRALGNLLRKELQLADTELRIKNARLTLEQLEKPFLEQKEAWEKEKAKQAAKARANAPE
jgi:sialate O-acetylesterase